MLYHIFDHGWLGLDSLGRITVRATLAGLIAFSIGVIVGRFFIQWFTRRQIGEETTGTGSDVLDTLHSNKMGTPTMGGLFIIGSALVATLLTCRWDIPFTWMMVAALVGFGALGFWDDYKKYSSGRGIRARTKMGGQLILALGLAVALYTTGAPDQVNGKLEGSTGKAPSPSVLIPMVGTPLIQPIQPIHQGFSLYIPVIKRTLIPFSALVAILFWIIVIVASSNAVNLADGLDGLAGGLWILTGGVFVLVAYAAGRLDWSSELTIPFVPGAGEVAIVLVAIVGATMAFLWYNGHPASVFMGDVGALPLGAAIGLAACICHQELLLIIAGGVFVAEAVSVMAQVGSFKLTGKRVLRCAPLHHHYQFGGWPETKVVMRFWLAGTVLAAAAIIMLKLS